VENLLYQKKESKNEVPKMKEIRKMFLELGQDESEEDEVINDLFFNSVKMVFDAGNELANDLANDLESESK
jgi:hypothetical protein